MPINSFLYPAKHVPVAYEVANSLRFNDGDSANLYKTPSSTGNRRKFTFSTWLKRASAFGVQQVFFGSWNANSDAGYTSLRFTNADELNLTGWSTNWFVTSRKFRDPSAWYHIVLSIDTENGTAGNRMRLYINGVEETSFSTNNNPSQNQDLSINVSGSEIYIASNEINGSKSNFLDGYLAETVLIDGQQLAADQFGEFDSDSPTIWKPKDVSGLTFGTNGFYLDFEDSSNLGNDANGGTDLTATNLTATDQSLDTCTNNFATLNPLNVPASNAPTFSEGNLQSVSNTSASGSFGGSSTIGVSTGKWYIETKCLTSGHTQSSVGVTYNDSETARTNNDATDTYEYSYRMNGNKQNNGDTSYGDTYTTNDIIGIALDLDNNKIYFSKNGTFQNSGDPTTGSTGTGAAFTVDSGQTYMFYHQDNTGASSNTSSVSFNFGSPAYAISSGNADANGYGNFEYSVPSGYFSLCTKNLAEFG